MKKQRELEKEEHRNEILEINEKNMEEKRKYYIEKQIEKEQKLLETKEQQEER